MASAAAGAPARPRMITVRGSGEASPPPAAGPPPPPPFRGAAEPPGGTPQRGGDVLWVRGEGQRGGGDVGPLAVRDAAGRGDPRGPVLWVRQTPRPADPDQAMGRPAAGLPPPVFPPPRYDVEMSTAEERQPIAGGQGRNGRVLPAASVRVDVAEANPSYEEADASGYGRRLSGGQDHLEGAYGNGMLVSKNGAVRGPMRDRESHDVRLRRQEYNQIGGLDRAHGSHVASNVGNGRAGALKPHGGEEEVAAGKSLTEYLRDGKNGLGQGTVGAGSGLENPLVWDNGEG